MAAAAEGIGALDLAGFGSSPDKRVAGVVNEALSRHSIKAPARPRCRPLTTTPPRPPATGTTTTTRARTIRRKDAREHAAPQRHQDGHGEGHERGHVAQHDHAKHGARPPAAHHDSPRRDAGGVSAGGPSRAGRPGARPRGVPSEARLGARRAPACPRGAPAGHEHGGGGELGRSRRARSRDGRARRSPREPEPGAAGPARADLASGRVDPRLVSVLTALTKEHKISLSVVISGHDQYTSGARSRTTSSGGGSTSRAWTGRSCANRIASRELAEALTDLPESIRPTEVGTPWPIDAPGFFTDGAHQDHLHIGFDGPAPVAAFQSPMAPAAALRGGRPGPAPRRHRRGRAGVEQAA